MYALAAFRIEEPVTHTVVPLLGYDAGVWTVESCGAGIISDRNHARHSQVPRHRRLVTCRQDTRHRRTGITVLSLCYTGARLPVLDSHLHCLSADSKWR